MNMRTAIGKAAVFALVAALVVVRPAWGEEGHSAEHESLQGSTLSMGKFYFGETGRVGTFPGKLVCLRCDLAPGPGHMEQCQKEGHRHALSMEDGSMVHPLMAGTAEVLKQINSGELHGKQVAVHGKHYPSTGAILVNRIDVRD